MSFIEIVIFAVAGVLGFGFIGLVQSAKRFRSKPEWVQAVLMSITSFISGFVMFVLIGSTLRPDEVLSERMLTGLQLGFFVGALLAIACLFLYLLKGAMLQLSVLVRTKQP